MHIEIGITTIDLGEMGNFSIFAYNGSVPGPTLRVSAGETVEISLQNNLKQGLRCKEDPDLEFCDMQVTNLHTHGLHVSSSSHLTTRFPDVADDTATKIPPGHEVKYHIKLPEEHFPGTFLYHAHAEHSTGLQAGGGAFGLLIVEDPPGFLPEVYANMEERHVIFQVVGNLKSIIKMSEEGQVSVWEDVYEKSGMNEGSYFFLVNGQYKPMTELHSGKWYRFRMAFVGTDSNFFKADISGDNTGRCEWKLLAKDGIYLDTIPRNVSRVYLASGNRADMAVRCECDQYPCEVEMSGSAWSGCGQNCSHTMMTLKILDNGGGADGDLPDTELPRPCYLGDLRKAEVTDVSKVSLMQELIEIEDGVTDHNNYIVFNNATVQMSQHEEMRMNVTMMTWPASATWPVGTVHEIHLDHADIHALHFHVNAMQIVEIPDWAKLDGWFEEGDYQDTFGNGNLNETDVVKLRLMTDMFTGRMMFHCHALMHEDLGMMAFIDVVGHEGDRYHALSELSPACRSP